MTGMLKPSPNEATQMLQDEAQRRRKARILQVREQEKMIAIRIRRAMQEKHDKEINTLANVLQKKWTKDHQEALKKSEEKFASCLKDVGSAHEEAKENAPNQALQDAIAEENRKAASDRGKSALEHQKHIKKMQEEESIEKRRKRHVALIKEKLRAKHIARLPPPFPNPADTYLNNTGATASSGLVSTGSIPHHPGRYTTIRLADHESTMTTTISLGLPSNGVVERATAAEAATDARDEAQKEGERINLLQAERDRAVQECMEKAKVRHQTALEQARLDRESKELMNDLKQLKMKDALRRQHHIEYSWDDNIQGKKACQELFGRPGARFQESELFSTDLKRSREDEIPSSVEERSTDDFTSGSQNTTGWMDVPKQEEQKPKEGRALNRLLKQIEAQRQQKKNGSGSSSTTSSETGNFRTEFNLQEDSDEVTESSQNDSTPPGEQARECTQEIMHPVTYDEKATIPKRVIPIPDLPKSAPTIITSQVKSPKVVQENVPGLSPDKLSPSVKERSKSNDQVGSKSESLLEKSLENMRNDEALLKSVKDFQERLLQQHKSCTKIQEQIQRLERKKATIDSMVAGVTKPKGF